MIFLNEVCTVLEPNISNLDKDEEEEDVELVIGLNDYDNFEEEEDKKVEEKVGGKCKKTPVKPDVYKEDVTTIHVPTQEPTLRPEIKQRIKFLTESVSKSVTKIPESVPKSMTKIPTTQKNLENLLAPIEVSSGTDHGKDLMIGVLHP